MPSINMPELRDAIDRCDTLIDDLEKQMQNDFKAMHNMLSVGEQDMPLYSEIDRRAKARKQTAQAIRLVLTALQSLL